MVFFKLDDQVVDTLDEVRCRAVIDFVDQLDPAGQDWPQVRALSRGEQVDGPALIEELDQLARSGASESFAPMLGNIRNDVLRTLRAQGKLGPTE